MITKKRELSCVHAASVPGARLEVHAAAMALELRAGMRVWLVGKDGSSDQAGGWIVANFALQSPRRSWEFAARSEEEAREWANAFDQTLFRMSSKAANVVRV